MFYFCISVDSSVVLRPLPAPRLGWQCPKAILPTQARILYKAPLFLQLSIINKIPSIVQSSPVLVSQFLPLDQVAIIADHFMNILPTSMIVLQGLLVTGATSKLEEPLQTKFGFYNKYSILTQYLSG